MGFLFFSFPFPCWFCFCLEPQEPIAAEVTVPLGNEITVPSAAVTQVGLCVDKFICHISQPFTVRGGKKPRGRAERCDPVSVGLWLWVLCVCPSSNMTPAQPWHQGSRVTAKTSHFQPWQRRLRAGSLLPSPPAYKHPARIKC